MDELQLQALGREILRLITVAEQMFMETKALRARIAELESKAETKEEDVPHP